MRYQIDTEFNEDGETILLISIGIVAEDGRELYCINEDARESACNEWVRTNVWPNLYACTPKGVPEDYFLGSRAAIRRHIEEFIRDDPDPQFWGYFADYDFVVFCWLWGAMVKLPKNFPMYCLDLKQYAYHLGVNKPKELVPPDPDAHNALADARWNDKLYKALVVRHLMLKGEHATREIALESANASPKAE